MGYISRRLKITFSVLALACLVMGWLAHNYTRFPGDLSFTLALQSFQNRPFLAAMEGISYVIDNWKGTIVVIIAAFIFWRKVGALEGAMIVLSELFTGAKELFKFIVSRPRPAIDLVQVFIVENGKSFPSGHSFFAVAVLGFIAYLIFDRMSKTWQKVLTVSLATLLILTVGISRIYLGVHWASDVIGGYLVGAVFLVLEVWIYRWLQSRSPDGASKS